MAAIVPLMFKSESPNIGLLFDQALKRFQSLEQNCHVNIFALNPELHLSNNIITKIRIVGGDVIS
jgi:hypothetical protein